MRMPFYVVRSACFLALSLFSYALLSESLFELKEMSVRELVQFVKNGGGAELIVHPEIYENKPSVMTALAQNGQAEVLASMADSDYDRGTKRVLAAGYGGSSGIVDIYGSYPKVMLAIAKNRGAKKLLQRLELIEDHPKVLIEVATKGYGEEIGGHIDYPIRYLDQPEVLLSVLQNGGDKNLGVKVTLMF